MAVSKAKKAKKKTAKKTVKKAVRKRGTSVQSKVSKAEWETRV